MVQAGHFVHHGAAPDTIEHIVDYLTAELKLRPADKANSNYTFKKMTTGATIRAFGLEECEVLKERFSAPL